MCHTQREKKMQTGIMVSKTLEDAKATYKALHDVETLSSCDELRLYSIQSGKATKFSVMKQGEVWRLITSVQNEDDFYQCKNHDATHLHARLVALNPVTLETVQETEENCVRVPICLDFDYMEPRMKGLTDDERQTKLVLHRRAIAKLCQLTCHVLWLRQQNSQIHQQQTTGYAHHYHPLVVSPFVNENVEVFVSDASGEYKESYKVSSHIVIRLKNGAFSNLNSSKVLAEFLNDTMREAVFKTESSNDECQMLLWKIATYVLPFQDFYCKDTSSMPFDVQIYSGRSLRMIGSFPRAGTNRILRPCDSDTMIPLKAPFSIDIVKTHDPWYASFAERNGNVLRFGFKNAKTSNSLYSNIETKCSHLDDAQLDKCVGALLCLCLRELKIPNPKRITQNDILPVSKFKHVLDSDGRFTHFEFHFNKTTYCPWRSKREGCKNANHTSRHLVLCLYPEKHAKAPFFYAKPPRSMCRLVCFSETCTKFCQRISGCGKNFRQAYINVETGDELSRRAAAFLLGEL